MLLLEISLFEIIYEGEITIKVTILGVVRELPVTTLTIEKDPIDPLGLNMVHCWRCGEKMIQIQGNVVRIIPGGLPQNILEMQALTVSQCDRCKTRYLINNMV